MKGPAQQLKAAQLRRVVRMSWSEKNIEVKFVDQILAKTLKTGPATWLLEQSTTFERLREVLPQNQ